MNAWTGALVVLLLSACASSSDRSPTAAADCSDAIRAGDVVLSSSGYTTERATRYGIADVAVCHDVGEGAPGSVFLDDPEQVVTWQFEDYPSDDVLGTRFDEATLQVFIADSVPDPERERIFRVLGGD